MEVVAGETCERACQRGQSAARVTRIQMMKSRQEINNHHDHLQQARTTTRHGKSCS